MAERFGWGAGATAAGIAYILWLDLLGGQGGHRLTGHQFGHQLLQVEIGVTGVEGG